MAGGGTDHNRAKTRAHACRGKLYASDDDDTFHTARPKGQDLPCAALEQAPDVALELIFLSLRFPAPTVAFSVRATAHSFVALPACLSKLFRPWTVCNALPPFCFPMWKTPSGSLKGTPKSMPLSTLPRFLHSTMWESCLSPPRFPSRSTSPVPLVSPRSSFDFQ